MSKTEVYVLSMKQISLPKYVAVKNAPTKPHEKVFVGCMGEISLPRGTDMKGVPSMLPNYINCTVGLKENVHFDFEAQIS